MAVGLRPVARWPPAPAAGTLAGGHRRSRVGLGPAHAAAADLLERQSGVERDRLDQLLEGHAGGQHAEVDAGALGDVGQHLPAGAHLARVLDRRAQALQAAVGMHDRALLLGARLGREDDVGVRGEAVGQDRGVGDDERSRRASACSQAARSGRSRSGSTWKR